MKHVLRNLILVFTVVLVTACGSGSGQSKINLNGTWKQKSSGDSWQEAVINDDYMEIYWVSDNGDSRMLYWAGSVTVPGTNEKSYSWTSQNDKDKTDFALLASSDDTKTFDFNDGELSYNVSLMGQASVLRLEKISETTSFSFGGKGNGNTADILSEDTASSSDLFQAEDVTDIADKTADNGIYYREMPMDKSTILSNLDIDEEYYGDRMAVKITNNNDFVIPDLDVNVVFYKNDTMIDTDSDGHDVLLPGRTVASKIDLPEDADSYKVSVDVSWDYATNYRNWADDIVFESNKGNDNVMIQFTNNSSVDIDELEYVVLYYKNGEFVYIGWPEDVYDFESGSTIVEKDEPYGISFDDYEVIINQAHTFGL